jgi:hypothetical protein
VQKTSGRTRLLRGWLLFLAAVASPALAQTNPNYTLGTDLNIVGGQGGARLNGHDSLVIAAPVATPLTGNPADPNNPICYTIQNKTGNDYFVPWRTAKEWTAFLDAIGAPYQLANSPYTGPNWPAPGGWVSAAINNSCCAPKTIGHICPDGSGPVSNIQLGYRYQGTPSGDQPYWAAQSDVYGPVYASVLNGDPNQTYRVTFVCSDSNWVQTHAEGSCLPVAGQCGAGTPGITALPPSCGNPLSADYCSELCAPTSIFGGFRNPGGASSPGPWTWTCQGTPGMADASCTSSSAVDGQCGPANGQPQGDTQNGWGQPADPNYLCANGTTPSVIGAWSYDHNIYNNPGTTYAPNLFHWTCSGIGGSTVTVSCSAPYAYGQCGPNSGNFTTTAPDPAVEFMCYAGTPSAVTYGPQNIWNGSGYSTTPGWGWTCSGAASPVTCAMYDSNAPQPGTCGSTNNTIYTSSTVPPSGNLCTGGSSLTSGPTLVLGSSSQWVWTCQGHNNGTTAECSAIYDPNPGVCGPAANPVLYPADPTTLGALCASGTATTVFNNGGGAWNWSCLSNLGNGPLCWSWMIGTGECGPANGVASLTAPSGSNLCGPTLDSASYVTNVNNTWAWTCTGSGGGATAVCSAPATGTTSGSCGIANGSASAYAPVLGLCASGAASSVVDNGSGQWTWTCTSAGGTANCSATNTATGPGVCGATNGTAIPDAPNVNLCASGAVGPVTGNGPWNWTCIGEGANAGQNASCAANICLACTGSITLGNTTPLITGKVSPSQCTVHGQATWLETDALNSSNASVNLQWNDPFYGSFSKTFNAVTAPAGYCPPCYQNMQSVSNAQVTVQAVAGSCPADASLNSGNPVVYTPTNVTVTP